MDDSNECYYAKIIVIILMTSIENIYLATQLNRDGDAHVHGLDVSYCAGWFEMNGLRLMVSVALVVFWVCCVFVKGLDIKMEETQARCHVSGNSPGYNTQTSGYKGLPYYRPFDVSRPKTRESR